MVRAHAVIAADLPEPIGVEGGGHDLAADSGADQRLALRVVDRTATAERASSAWPGEIGEHDVAAVVEGASRVVDVTPVLTADDIGRRCHVDQRIVVGQRPGVLREAAVVADREAERPTVDGQDGAISTRLEELGLGRQQVLLVVRVAHPAVAVDDEDADRTSRAGPYAGADDADRPGSGTGRSDRPQ